MAACHLSPPPSTRILSSGTASLLLFLGHHLELANSPPRLTLLSPIERPYLSLPTPLRPHLSLPLLLRPRSLLDLPQSLSPPRTHFPPFLTIRPARRENHQWEKRLRTASVQLSRRRTSLRPPSSPTLDLSPASLLSLPQAPPSATRIQIRTNPNRIRSGSKPV